MGIRKEGKIITRQKIISETKSVLFEKGYIKMSTKDISERSEVSQGTIFLHFKSKGNLLNYIITQLIDDFSDEFKTECSINSTRQDFMQMVLTVFANHENILSVVYRDYNYLTDEIKKSIDQIESTIKSMFFDNIRNSKGKEISIVDSFVLIDGFLSQIKILLINKDLNSSLNIIKQSSGKLGKLHKCLIQ